MRGRRRSGVRRVLRAWAAAAGRAVDVRETVDAADARRRAAEAAGRGVDAVVAAGGDGTLQSVAAGLLDVGDDADDRPALVVAPLGRGNDLARCLGLRRGVRDALEALTRGKDRPLDVGRAEVDGTKHVFVNALGIGLDAAVARRARRIRLPGGGAYHVAALTAILRERGPWRLTGTIDATPVDRKATVLHVGNGDTTGGGYRLTPAARPDDGRLDTCCYLETSRRRILAMLPKAARGRHVGAPGVEIGRHARLDLRIDPPAPVHGDGEVFATRARTVRAWVIPGALHVRLRR